MASSGRRPRIILGVTGSIAAVKGPRLALRLANELKADVKVVLSRTVEQYFWKEGRAVHAYDEECWTDFEALVKNSLTARDGDDDQNACGRVSIHCE